MESIRELFRIGIGPSSSHTMGPRIATEEFLRRHPMAQRFQVTLYGSLAATGKGHLTEQAIRRTLNSYQLDIVWKPEVFLPRHPNAMEFAAYADEWLLETWRVYSIGGGAIRDDLSPAEPESAYPFTTMSDILPWTDKNGKSFYDYVFVHESPETRNHLEIVWEIMQVAVNRGLEAEGTLPGTLSLPRKASSVYIKALNTAGFLQKISLTFAYALAVAEENAAGGQIVTAPTCGSCGVLPAVLQQLSQTYSFSQVKIIRALATAGLIGNLVKKNASISGAEVGCQGEIGTACAMAAAAATQLMGGTTSQIEYAAEMGLEHHLGLTCDPVDGLVQIPCIERNAMAAERSLDCAAYALLGDGRHRISFDEVVRAMVETGRDLKTDYKETSLAGLARIRR